MSSPASACLTSAAPFPTTIYICSGFNPLTADKTQRTSGVPARGCSTLARADFMRVPSPAASITTESLFMVNVQKIK
jgi:hypothetical protein